MFTTYRTLQVLIGDIGAEDATERSISFAKQSRRDEEREDGRRSRVEDRAIAREAIFDPQSASSSPWLNFHRSRESIRNVCDVEYRVDASRRRAICPAIRRGPLCL